MCMDFIIMIIYVRCCFSVRFLYQVVNKFVFLTRDADKTLRSLNIFFSSSGRVGYLVHISLLFENKDFTLRHHNDHEVLAFSISEAYSLDEVTWSGRNLANLRILRASVGLPEADAVVRHRGRNHLVSFRYVYGNNIADVRTRLGSVANRFNSVRDTGLRDEGDEAVPAGHTSALLATLLEEQDVGYLML